MFYRCILKFHLLCDNNIWYTTFLNLNSKHNKVASMHCLYEWIIWVWLIRLPYQRLKRQQLGTSRFCLALLIISKSEVDRLLGDVALSLNVKIRYLMARITHLASYSFFFFFFSFFFLFLFFFFFCQNVLSIVEWAH